MRIPGLGGKLPAKAGGTVVVLPGREIFSSLERRVIDATKWVGLLNDLRMGIYQATKVNKAFRDFQKVVGTWGSISETAYYNIIQPKFSLKG